MMRFRAQTVLAVVMTVATTASVEAADTFERWAVIASEELRASGLADLVLAELSEIDGISLVERDQIERATRELSLSQMLGAEGVGTRLQLGRMLRADVLVIIETQPYGDKTVLRLVLADCIYGARLRVDQFLVEDDNEAELATKVREAVTRTRDHFRTGITCIVGVAPLVSRTLVHDWDYLQDSLAHVIQNTFASVPGVAVIEVAEAHRIREERTIAAGREAERERIVPLLVEGEYKARRDPNADEPTMSLTARVSNAQETLHTITKENLTLPAAAELLRRETHRWASTLSGEPASEALSIDQQVAFMTTQADNFAKLGDYCHSTALREACLLLAPDNDEQRIRVACEYVRGIYTRAIPPPPADNDELAYYEKTCAALILCYGHLDILTRRNPPPVEALEKTIGLGGGFRSELDQFRRFWFCGERPFYPPSTEARPFLDRAEAERRRFFMECTPRLLGHMSDADWQSMLMEFTNNLLVGVHYDPVLKESPLVAELLERVIPESQPLGSDVVKYFTWDVGNFCTHPNPYDPDEAVRAFLDRLRRSKSPRNHFLARFGSLCYDMCWFRESGAIPDIAMLREVQDMIDELGDSEPSLTAALGTYANEIVDAMGLVDDIRAMSARKPRRYQAPPTEERSRTKSRREEVTNLPVEPLTIRLKRSDGRERMLAGCRWHNQGQFQIEALLHTPCGDAFEVFWHEGVVLYHRTPGLFEEVLTATKERFGSVVWDGKHVWVGTFDQGVYAIALSGEVVARVTSEQGLPPSNGTIRLIAVEPDRVLAVGSFGGNPRTWFALLSYSTDPPSVHVFYEATKVSSEGEERTNAMDIGFTPSWVRTLPPQSDYAEKVVIGRPWQDALVVDTKTLRVSVLGDDLPWPEEAFRETSYLLDNAWIRTDYGAAYYAMRVLAHSSKRTRDFTELASTSNFDYRTRLLVVDGCLLIPGDLWLRVDRTTRRVEKFLAQPASPDDGQGPGPRLRPYSARRDFFDDAHSLNCCKSVHFGVLVWNEQNEFFRLHVPPPTPMASTNDQSAQEKPSRAAAARRRGRHRPGLLEKVTGYNNEDAAIQMGLFCVVGVLAAAFAFRPRKRSRPNAADTHERDAPTPVATDTDKRRRLAIALRLVSLIIAGLCLTRVVIMVIPPTIPNDPPRSQYDEWSESDYRKATVSALAARLDPRELDGYAVAELKRRIESNELRGADLGTAIGSVLFYAREADFEGYDPKDAVRACISAFFHHRLTPPYNAAIASVIAPARLWYCPRDRSIALWGTTEYLDDDQTFRLLTRRRVEIVSVDGKATHNVVFDAVCTGRWLMITSPHQHPIDASESLRVRVTTSWYDASSLSRSPDALQPSQLDRLGEPLATAVHEHTLRPSAHVSALFGTPHWPVQRVGDEDVDIAPGPNAFARADEPSGQPDAEATTTKETESLSSTETPNDASAVLVVDIARGSQARWAGIQPGDVITHVTGIPVRGLQSFQNVIERLGDRERRLTIDRDGESKEFRFEPWQIGIYIADYRDSYGPALAEAVRAMADGRFAEARTAFRRAFQAGLVFEGDSFVQAEWARCLYYNKDLNGAYRELQSFADRVGRPDAWDKLLNSFEWLATPVPHLPLYVAEQAMRDEKPVVGTLVASDILTHDLARYPESLVYTAKALEMTLSEKQYAICRQNQIDALSGLGLQEEVIALAQELYRDPRTERVWQALFDAAYSAGRAQLARNLAEGIYERDQWHRSTEWRCQLLAAIVETHDWQAAETMVADVFDIRDIEALFTPYLPVGYGGLEAEPLWRTAAQRVFESSYTDERERIDALRALIRQSKPDLSEIEKRITELKGSPNRRTSVDASDPTWLQLQADLHLIRGEFEAAAKLLQSQRNHGWVHESERHALQFLREHADDLTDDDDVWRRTRRAFSVGGRGWILLTQDGHLGWTTKDGTEIREIPAPADPWWVSNPNDAIIVSPRANVVLATDQWDVYRLDLEANAWRLIAERPWSFDPEAQWRLRPWQPFLDELVHYLEPKDGRPAQIVWPRTQQNYEYPWITLMLSDGTWLLGDQQDRHLYQPKQLAAGAPGTPVEIYEIMPASSDWNRVYLFTSRGLLLWQPSEASITACTMPAGFEPGPMLRADDQNMVPGGHVRIGLFPDRGGTTFLLDVAQGTITHEGLVNEGYPRTFWRQKSTDWKRQHCQRKFAEAGIPWPFTQSPESRSARQANSP